MRTIVVMIALLVTVGLGLSLAQSADEAAIKKLNEDYATAIQERDVKAAAALHTADAVRAAPGSIAVGQAKIVASLTEQFAGASTAGGSSVEIKIHDINMITDDVAIIHGAFKTSGASGHFIRTVVKEDGSWKIAAIQIAADPTP